MEHKSIITIVFYILILLLTGCGGSDEEILSTNVELDLTVKSESEEIPSTNVELDLTVKFESEELLDEFLASKIPAVYDVDDESAIMFDDLTFGEEDWCSYSVGERVDLDNDGESEQYKGSLRRDVSGRKKRKGICVGRRRWDITDTVSHKLRQCRVDCL